MSLSINTAPSYELILPVSKQRVKYRPFLVKEEKHLMLAMQEDDADNIQHAIVEMIKACTFEALNMDKLTMPDLEFLFVSIRNKSMGEGLSLIVECEHCSHKTPMEFNLANVKVEGNFDNETNISIGQDLSVTMRPLNIKDQMEIEKFDDVYDIKVNTIARGIKYIQNKDKLFEADDSKFADILEFVEGMTKDQFRKMTEFFKNTPKLVFRDKYTCAKCGKENEVVVEGLPDFFD